jgi:hypothetical protein
VLDKHSVEAPLSLAVDEASVISPPNYSEKVCFQEKSVTVLRHDMVKRLVTKYGHDFNSTKACFVLACMIIVWTWLCGFQSNSWAMDL